MHLDMIWIETNKRFDAMCRVCLKRNIKSMYPKKIIKPYIIEGVGVPECLSRGYPVYDYPQTQNVKKRGFVDIFKKVTVELKKRIDKL